MPSGWTTTQTLADSLPKEIGSARVIQEYASVMSRLLRKERLGEGVGDTWYEIALSKLTAQGVTETTDLENYQQIVDTSLSVKPTMVGIATLITEKTLRNISGKVAAKITALCQSAIERRVEADCLAMLDGFSTSLGGAGTTNSFANISAAVSRITSNTTEPFASQPKYAVLHGFQVKDIQDEVLSGVGTYAVPEGLTAQVFRRGFKGTVANAEVYVADNLPIDGSDDAKGGVFAGGQTGALVLVRGKNPWTYTEFKAGKGGGANIVYYYDEYGLGEVADSGGVEIYTDATAPS